MHWTAAQPGCLDAERELILVEQTPGEIVFLSAADSDLAAVAEAWRERFGGRLRVAHPGHRAKYLPRPPWTQGS